MISAVAARKAALSAQINPSPQKNVSPASSPKQHQSNAATPLAKRRKRTQDPIQSIRKKKKKVVHTSQSKPKTRYFEHRDVFQGQDDVVSIPSDDDEQELSDISNGMDVDSDAVDGGHDALRLKSDHRGWSPSHPVYDSSDEDEDEGGNLNKSIASFSGPGEVLSSFQPIQNQNLFYIDDLSELSSFDLDLSSISTPATIVSLKLDETLTLVGAYKLIVLDGSITLCGVPLAPSRETHDVFAPRSSPLPIITACIPNSESLKLPSSVPDKLRTCFGNGNAVVLLQELRTNVEGLGRICRIFDGVFRPSPRYRVDETSDDIRIGGVHIVTTRTKDVQPYILPSSWKTALDSAIVAEEGSAGVYLVKGPRNSGKSSFARTLLNQLLTRYTKVAYLECDLGQSEFTPGGMVALNVIETPLFGPPFTHPTLPNHAHYIGSTTPRPSPSHYLTSIQSLIEFYRLDVQTPAFDVSTSSSSTTEKCRIANSIPLVVNTMGWAKGLGADLTHKIEEMLEPSHIFEFESPAFDGGWSTNSRQPYYNSVSRLQTSIHHTLSPIPPESTITAYSSADHRTLSLLSYLHAIFPSHDDDGGGGGGDVSKSLREHLVQLTAKSWNTSLPLCARYPYEVDVRAAFDKIILTGAGAEDVVPSEIERVLSGSIVGLVNCDPGTLDVNPIPNPSEDMSIVQRSSQPHTLIPYTQKTPPPSPLTSSAHGIALIRSVAPGGSHLHILTPLPPKLLSRTRVGVKGEMELPVWGFLDMMSNTGKDDVSGVAGCERSKVPYLQWGKGDGIGAEKRRVRRNLMRKGQV